MDIVRRRFGSGEGLKEHRSSDMPPSREPFQRSFEDVDMAYSLFCMIYTSPFAAPWRQVSSRNACWRFPGNLPGPESERQRTCASLTVRHETVTQLNDNLETAFDTLD